MKNILFRHIILLVVTNCLVTPIYAQFTFLQSFKGNVLPSNIIVGGSPSSAYLTSGNGDASNDGWLRLTNSNLNQKGFAYINSTFPSSLGILIDFQYTAWRDYGSDVGADGIGVFLFDAASTSTFALGGWGGSLAYAPNTTLGTTTGLAGGYIGIGLDEYGNSSNPTEGRVGGPGQQCNSITLRGPTTSNPSTTNPYLTSYQLQTSNTSDVNSIDYNTVTTTRPTDAQFYRRVKISIVPIGTVMVPKFRITASWRLSPGGSDTQLFTYDTNTPPPALLKLGFAASTSRSYNYHEIRNLIVTTPGGFRVDESVDKVSASVSNQLTYTVNVYNATAGPATNLRLSDVIKDGLGNIVDIGSSANFTVNSITFNNNSNPNNTATGFPNGVSITQGLTNPFTTTLNMDGNTISTFTIVGTINKLPAGGGVLTNSVTIDPSLTGIADNDATNNNFSVSTNVLNCDFVINNTLDNSCADPTNGNSYTLLVSNNGTINSTAGKTVTVTDNIPTGFTVTSTNSAETGWSVSNVGNTYTFKRTDALAFGDSYPPIVISFKAPSTGTSWVNSTVVAYSGIEATRTNNNSSVTLYASPTAPVVSTPVSYCQGNTPVTLTASGTNLMWYTTLGGAGSTTAPVPSTAKSGTTTYYVTQSNGSCESKPSAIVVTVNPLLTATISGTTAVCQNAVLPYITFTGSGGTAPFTFTYTVNGGSPQTVTTTSGNSAAVSQTTIAPGSFVYSLVNVKDVGNSACSNVQTGTSTITVNPLPTATIGGTTTHNYIQTKTYLEADASRSVDIIQYFDGLGRPSQTVQGAITPTGADLVTGIMYDSFGRDSLKCLPAVVGGNNGAYYPNFATQAVSSNGDAKPYSRTEYEPSPLNRVTGQYGVGADWYDVGKKDSIKYQTNSTNDVIYFDVNGDGQLVRNGFYDANTLYVTLTTDEDTKSTAEYKDKLSRVVLKRCEEGGHVDTYYVYNDLGQLSFVLPPRAVDGLRSITNAIEATNDNDLGKLGYAYKYDERGNCIYKKLPGCDPIYMVYDKANRLALSQNGNQRVKGYWTQLYYNVFGKILYEMEVKIDASYEMLVLSFSSRFNVDSFNSAIATMLNTGYSLSVDMSFTYRKPSVPGGPTSGATFIGITFVRLLVVNYYDGYEFINLLTADTDKSTLPFIALDGYDGRFISANGLLTGTRVYHLEDPTKFEVTAYFYDKNGRVVQTRATNHLGGYDLAYNALDFRGKVLKTRKEHNIFGQAVISEVYRYAYDKAERLIMTRYKLGANDTITLVSNFYDELGRLTTTLRHNNKDNCSNEYNIRNWKTKIKSGTFEEHLYYNTNLPSGATPNYNGNIAYSTWTYNGVNKGYIYSYDGLNRLINATFKQGSSAQPDGYFDEKFTYDSHGNIMTLKRKKNNVLIDDLAMSLQGSYIGNQLQYVNDNGISQHLYDTKEYNDNSSANSNEFNYDYNGNMIKDSDRNIVTIRYNILNLPDTIQFKNGYQILNSYTAAGQKIGTEYFTNVSGVTMPVTGQVIKTFPTNCFSQNGTAYIDNKEYNTLNGSSSLTNLQRIYNIEGYAENITSSPNYYYYRRDHLGDNREVWLANSDSTVQRTQYYPSGLPWASNDGDKPSKQQRKYNGKEFVEMQGYDTYDYGARGYYAASGRFTSVDPLAEKYYSISPYAYCMNNPVKYVDPDGRKIEGFYINNLGTVYYNKNATKDAVIIANAMMRTDAGNTTLKNLVNARYPVTLNIQEGKSKSNPDLLGHTETYTNKLKDPETGKIISKKEITKVDITFFKEKLQEMVDAYRGMANGTKEMKDPDDRDLLYKQLGPSLEDMYTTVATHEGTHGSKKGANSNFVSTEKAEKSAESAEKESINQLINKRNENK